MVKRLERPEHFTKNYAEDKLQGMTRIALAQEEGVSPEICRRWLKELGLDGGFKERPSWFTREVYQAYRALGMTNKQIQARVGASKAVFQRYMDELGVWKKGGQSNGMVRK